MEERNLTCPACGAHASAGASVCRYCGYNFEQNASSNKSRNRRKIAAVVCLAVTAVLLVLLLAVIGRIVFSPDRDEPSTSYAAGTSAAAEPAQTTEAHAPEQTTEAKTLTAPELDVRALIDAQGSSPGETLPTAPNDGTLSFPLPYQYSYISTSFPYRADGRQHHGVDISVAGNSYGKDILAAQSGVVLAVGTDSPVMGDYYIVLDHGNGLFTAYNHCDELQVERGQTVTQGQVIAKVGHSGDMTSPHLHFEVLKKETDYVRWMNPLDYVSVH